MATFLDWVNGAVRQIAAISTSTGAADAGKLVELGANGRFDASVMPTGVGSEAVTKTASESLSAAALVNFHGTDQMRNADADNGRPAHGFVLAAVTSGASGTAYPEEGIITGLTSLTPGATQFLSTTAGARTETSPTGAGVLGQQVGVAKSATEMHFRPGTAIVQA